MAEGFEQGTDRAFARYLIIAKGSCAEVGTHLAVAHVRGHLAADTVSDLRKDAQEIVRMLDGLIKYLLRCDRKRRLP
jgi:four helix bundle protein